MGQKLIHTGSHNGMAKGGKKIFANGMTETNDVQFNNGAPQSSTA
jgi:hypothetical protein